MRPCLTVLTLGVVTSLALPASAAPAKETVQVQVALNASGSSAQETNAGDLIADAVKQTAGADIALVAADELTDASVPAGAVAPAKLNDLLHYAEDGTDTVVVLKLTGAQILRALELGVGHAPRPSPGFWQMSGVQVRYDANQPEGKRISLAGIGGSEINAGKTYTVATTRPVALGNLGYFRVWDKKDIARDTGVSVAQSLTAYAGTHKTLGASVESRITSAN